MILKMKATCKGAGGWHIDHSHKDNKIRSVLCNRCNVAIGMIREDINIAFSIIEYLKGKE